MNKSRFYDEMDIQAVESKLNDVTVTAIPMSSVPQSKQQQYGHHRSNSNSSSHYQSSKSQKNQSNQYLTYQQNQLIQSAIQMVQQQQLQQQRQRQQEREREREREREMYERSNLDRLGKSNAKQLLAKGILQLGFPPI